MSTRDTVDRGSMTVIELGLTGTMTFTDNPHGMDLDLGFPQIATQLTGLPASASRECSREAAAASLPAAGATFLARGARAPGRGRWVARRRGRP